MERVDEEPMEVADDEAHESKEEEEPAEDDDEVEADDHEGHDGHDDHGWRQEDDTAPWRQDGNGARRARHDGGWRHHGYGHHGGHGGWGCQRPKPHWAQHHWRQSKGHGKGHRDEWGGEYVQGGYRDVAGNFYPYPGPYIEPFQLFDCLSHCSTALHLQ